MLYKTTKEIDTDDKLPASLKPKFKIALEEFGKLGIKGVLQGDLMFTKADLSTETIDGQRYTTFQPNTIVYAIPASSPLDIKIKQAKIGVVWHTTYTGSTLQDMKASFGANISGLRKSSAVWMDDATYKDESGTATFTKAETAAITAKLAEVGRVFQSINSAELNSFLRLQSSFTGKMAGASFKTYNNSKVRQGQKVNNPAQHVKGYTKWVEDRFDIEINKLKTPKSREALEAKKKASITEIKRRQNLITRTVSFQNLVTDAKMMIVNKLNSVKQMTGTFIKTENGFKVTDHEGYVAIDRVDGNAVKLVDRMEFSYNNFTAIKAWDK